MQQETVLNLSTKKINLIIFIILALHPLIGMGVDLIAPSLPAITHDLQVSTTLSKNLIAIYLFGYALGNFFVGFLSDALGRRKLVVNGMGIFVIASLLPTIFVTPGMLLFARFLQGFTLAAYAVVGRAILSDILEPHKLIQIATMLATMWGIGPIIGPVIGAYLQYYFNWQACFYFFAIIGFIGFIALLFKVPETHTRRQPLNFKQIANNFMTIIQHRLFLGMVILMGASYSLLIVFNTLGPFLIQTQLGFSAVDFGHLALSMGIIFLLATFVCRHLVRRYPSENILRIVVPFFFLITLTGLVFSYFYPQSIWVIAITSYFMFFCSGIVYPAGMGKGLALFRHLAGSGSAMMNLINILITTLTALLMSFIHSKTIIPMAWVYFALMLISCFSYYFLVRLGQPKAMSKSN